MIEKEGYRTETMPLDKKYDGVALLSIFWDLSTTDFITGAAYEYQPSTYHFKMKKEAKWAANFGHLDRSLEDELTAFVLINFYSLDRTDSKDLIEALVTLVSSFYEISKEDAHADLARMLRKSKTPLELLRLIHDQEQTYKPR